MGNFLGTKKTVNCLIISFKMSNCLLKIAFRNKRGDSKSSSDFSNDTLRPDFIDTSEK